MARPAVEIPGRAALDFLFTLCSMRAMSLTRIIVTVAEMESAILVWLRVMPEGVWRKNEEEERKRAEKKWSFGEFPDPKVELAKYLARKFFAVGWEATYEKRGNLFGGPSEGEPPKAGEAGADGPVREQG